MIKNIIFIAAIGLAVAFSGCIWLENKSSVSRLTPAAQTQGYQLSLGVKTLADCIVYGGITQPCSQVNLYIMNTNPQRLEIAVVKNTLVLKNGVSREMYENVGGLSTACVRRTGLQFKLAANSGQNIAICYPLVHNSDAPVLEITVMINGVRRDYSFDLARYGLT